MHIKGTTAGPTTIILAVLSSMGGFLFGYDTGQIAGESRFPSATTREMSF
jgi:hypothetical protein